tara:strand:- start:1537 stop:1725 length:189 start_codon:yes stop_codon:yes gene_type:complete
MAEKGCDLSGFGVIEVTWPKAVDKVTVSSVGGDAPGAGMGLREISIGFEARHIISDRGCGNI